MSPPSGAGSQTFFVLSRNGEPRWLLPAGQRRVDSVLAGWSPYRFGSLLKWHAVRAANRFGCLSLLPGMATSTVVAFDHIDWASVGWNGATPPVPAVYLGTPGPARKAVIHLLDSSSGVCHVVVKVPINEGARAAILREANVLVSLASECRTFLPRLLYLDRGRGISTQTFLTGGSGSRGLLPEYLLLLRALSLLGETTSIVEHAAMLQEQLLWSATSDHDLATISTALSILCDAAQLPAFWVHGDFAPWNIKHPSDGLPCLLDWEDAQRGGLPLQDAFHFLHVQDYLFGQRPTSHAKQLHHFADELGLTTTQCHKLEVAYLAHSYLQRLTQQQPHHSDFLLNALRIVLREDRPTAPSFSFGRNQPILPPESPSSSTALHIRSDLFSAVIDQFNLAQLPYCLLSGYEDYPGRIPSDVDFMVLPADMPRVPTLLAQAANNCGAQVVQAIQHEASACYYVLAKDGGREVGFINPDCCSDYRRRGRMWLRADTILTARRAFKNFWVPSVPHEFIYYLIKKVLKQSIDARQVRQLHGLYQRARQDCDTWLHRFWSTPTANAIERALIKEDLSWFASHYGLLLSELEASPPVEPPLDRFASTLGRLAVSLKRVAQPTGMCVIVSGGAKDQVRTIATALQQSLTPAFRWTSTLPVASAQPCGDSGNKEDGLGPMQCPALKLCRHAIKIRIARVRSTLAICTFDQDDVSARRGPLSSMFTRLLWRPDLVLVLSSYSHPEISNAASAQRHSLLPLGHCSVSYLNKARSVEETVYQASRVVLQWLSTRQERRLNPDKGPLTPLEAPFPERNSDLPDPSCLEGD